MAKRRLTRAEILAQLPAARARERVARRAGMRARSAAYDARRDLLVLELTSGVLFGFPPTIVPALRRLTRQQLARVALSPSGGGLHWDEPDVQLSVPGLLLTSFNRSEAVRELARVAGRSRSDAKTRAARANGAKGGRPRKVSAR
jgi:hypothetical protein